MSDVSRQIRLKIEQLSDAMPVDEFIPSFTEKNTWAEFWRIAKETQGLFNSAGRDIQKDERQALWNAFNKLRDSAREKQQIDNERFNQN